MNACPAIITGDRFLTRTIDHIDCQAHYLGSYGWQALGEPGSLAATVMMGLLTLFVALYGVRLLFGPAPGGRDLAIDAVKVGLVLTLAFSWPAFRTLVHDVVLDGPGEVAASLTTPGLASVNLGFVQRLQQADNAMVRLTESGTGRQTGQFVDAEQAGGTFKGTALLDGESMGNARLFWLAGIIGIFALLRLFAGLMLALAPLAAGLLLFEATRGLFSGWLRGLVLTLVGAVGASLVLAVELAVLEPWLADAMRLRALGYATPSAPTELLAITAAFALVQVGMLVLMARVAWTRGWPTLPAVPVVQMSSVPWSRSNRIADRHPAIAPSRAARLSSSVEMQLRREETGSIGGRVPARSLTTGEASSPRSSATSLASSSPARLGSSFRRTATRQSLAAGRRDAMA